MKTKRRMELKREDRKPLSGEEGMIRGARDIAQLSNKWEAIIWRQAVVMCNRNILLTGAAFVGSFILMARKPRVHRPGALHHVISLLTTKF